MPSLFDRFAAGVARFHAEQVFARFHAAARQVELSQEKALRRALRVVAEGEYGRRLKLDRVRNADDFRRAAPLTTYEDLRPWIERTLDGDERALFSRGGRVRMFATSSGTTALRKHIPVTPEFIEDYRRGWNTFGLKLLTDHPRAILRPILQSTGRHDESQTRGGTPIGAITGLLARTQKRLVQRYYVGVPDIARISDSTARYYTLMRCGVVRDVAFCITANPATLIRMAQVADEWSETLIRDVRDGTLSEQAADDPALRRALRGKFRPDAVRARELETLRAAHGRLRPRDYWRLEFLACWTASSMALHLDRLAQWYGPTPIRDIGLLASEGRVSIPFANGAPAGALDVPGAFFEFIPIEQVEADNPHTLTARELEVGRDYVVVLTNTAGLIRYRLDDVVRVSGWYEQTPLVEFLRRAGRVVSIVGEKLTEDQTLAALAKVRAELGLAEFDCMLCPVLNDPPNYRLTCSATDDRLAAALDRALAEQNEEYDSRRRSLRLGPVFVRHASAETFAAFDRRLIAERGGAAEQYKRPCLLLSPNEDERLIPDGQRNDGPAIASHPFVASSETS